MFLSTTIDFPVILDGQFCSVNRIFTNNCFEAQKLPTEVASHVMRSKMVVTGAGQ
jgi:hypothetical protein